MTAPTRIAPGPHLAPEIWNRIGIGTYTFPAEARRGGVKVKLKTSSEWTEDKATGKDYAKAKFKGRKVATGTVEFRFTRHIYEASRALQLELDPSGPNADKPWPVDYPEFAERGANRIIVKSMSDTTIQGYSYAFTIEVDAWYEPARATVGGTSTPKAPVPGGAGGGLQAALVAAGAKTIALGEVQPPNGVGFDGPGAPGVDPGA